MPTSRISARILAGAMPGLRQGVQSYGSGAGAYDQGFDQAATLQSKLAQALATTRAYNSKADQDEAETGVLTSRPGLAEEQVAMQAGVTVPQVRAAREYTRTGKPSALEVPDLSNLDAGPPPSVALNSAQQSKIAGALRQMLPVLTNVKDNKADDLANAAKIYQQVDGAQAVIDGKSPATNFGRAMAAAAGKPLFNADATGAVLDNFAGTLDTSNPMAGSTLALRSAQAGAQRANAAQSYASADNSRASAARTRNEMERGMKSGDIVVQQGADGTVMLVNKLTGLARPATSADGTSLAGKMAAPKEMTEGQAKDNGYGSRMQEADSVLRKLKYSPTAVNAKTATDGVPLIGTIANWALPEEAQQAEQAQRDFINAILRRESGAAIADSEFANAKKQYFPQPADKPETLRQKERNRQIAIEGVFGSVPTAKRGVPSLTNPIGTPPAPTGGPTPGAVQGGYRFKGGNPADQSNWEPVR